MVDCHPGQRWFSHAEPELGLGIVFQVEHRRVTVDFPASDERRIYASDNAPLARVLYRPGELVRGEDGTELIVSELVEHDDCTVYVGLSARGEPAKLHEIDLNSFVQFSRPLDRLLTGQIDKPLRAGLRRRTLEHHHRVWRSPVAGLLGPRVQLLPHQFYIAHQVSERHRPRVLLADEVGLGKTIEAGLILHRLLLTGQARRVLILVPPNLVHQWLVEMLRRFNLQFSIYDTAQCESLMDSGETNPFECAQLVLAPLDTLVDEPKLAELAHAATWDLVVVDEAHHLSWHDGEGSAAYRCVEHLAGSAPGILLLTATPQQLGLEGHFARLRLLDPHRYTSLEAFVAEENDYRRLGDLVERARDEGDALTAATRSAAAELLGPTAAEAPADVIARRLLDRYGTGRVLFRNCRDSVGGFPRRQLHAWPLPLPDPWREAGAAQCPDDWLASAAIPGETWVRMDPRVGWLADWAGSHRGDKALVICADTERAEELELHLRLRCGIRTALFHEAMDLVARDRAAAYFSDPEDDAQVLVCSEIGSEGRNFQIARHLVLFDLPTNPDLLEQRIGRLDRIGQTGTVEIHVPYFERSGQAVRLRWLDEGCDAFEQPAPAGPMLHEEFARELDDATAQCDDDRRADALIAATRARATEINTRLREGRDRLLEQNSFDPAAARQLVEAIAELDDHAQLGTLMEGIFDEFGVETEADSNDGLILQPGDHMICEAFPGLPEGGLSVTFERSDALGRDDRHFLTWEHPMVLGAMDMILSGEFGNATFGTVKHSELRPGSVFVETSFVLVCVAPPALRPMRFIERSSLRLVIDGSGSDWTRQLSAEWIDGAIHAVPSATAQKVVSTLRGRISDAVEHASHLAEASQESILDQAVAQMTARYGDEIERVRELGRINPNVSPAEVTALEEEAERLAEYLRTSQMKLDAVRVFVAT